MSYSEDNEYNPDALKQQMIQVEKPENSDYESSSPRKTKKRLIKKVKREEYEEDYDQPEEVNDEDEYNEESGEDYSENYDDSPKKHKKHKKKEKAKKKKKGKKINFFEDEAVDTSEAEESDVGEITHKVASQLEKDVYKSRNKVNIAQQIEDKFRGADDEEIDKIYDADIVYEKKSDYLNNKQPKPSDPHLWLVKCKIGKEKDSVSDLLHKYFYNHKSANLKIFSALSIDALKGYIYIEAFKEANVREAIAGMSNLRENSIKIVPPNEMVQIFNFDKIEKIDIKKGQWVRIKTGLYENDLAQVVDIEDTANKIYIKIIPRIFENTGKENIGDYSKQIKNNLKPKQQFFNPHIHGTKEMKRHNFLQQMLYYWRNKYFKDGFLIKCVKAKSLIYENVVPKIEELRIFESATEGNKESSNLFDTLIHNTDISRRSKYIKGDKVKLIQGNLKGIIGNVVSHIGNEVVLIPNVQGYNEELKFPESYLMKHFLPGDLVTVEKGTNHVGKTGIVVKIEDDIAVIFCESALGVSEFKVAVNDLVHASRAGKEKSESCQFELEDLVKINGTNHYSFILDIQGHSLKLIDFNNQIKTLSIRDVTKVSSK